MVTIKVGSGRKFNVHISKAARETAEKMPIREQSILKTLVEEMQLLGPIRKNRRNFSAIGKNKFHCHLSYKWIACWEWKRGTIIIEVFYVGSREKAPY
jgi:mRNA-degrading endonuclease RelE of RelBE toxin-antitoxin system